MGHGRRGSKRKRDGKRPDIDEPSLSRGRKRKPLVLGISITLKSVLFSNEKGKKPTRRGQLDQANLCKLKGYLANRT